MDSTSELLLLFVIPSEAVREGAGAAEAAAVAIVVAEATAVSISAAQALTSAAAEVLFSSPRAASSSGCVFGAPYIIGHSMEASM